MKLSNVLVIFLLTENKDTPVLESWAIVFSFYKVEQSQLAINSSIGVGLKLLCSLLFWRLSPRQKIAHFFLQIFR